MGLRYFDRVVVVSAGRFTEMEAYDGPWIGITNGKPRNTQGPREFSDVLGSKVMETAPFQKICERNRYETKHFFKCCIRFGLSSAGRASGRTGATQRSILHGEDKGGSRHRQ